jgi:hypothetical protein
MSSAVVFPMVVEWYSYSGVVMVMWVMVMWVMVCRWCADGDGIESICQAYYQNT